ncbi:hypothetical protein [Saccharopolyspora shandongensis]|uniref:hypothetical protein n=1 Tax=Saccharopolyspora shandongensis TaxID=418495 RepID=UPI0033E2281F
MEGSQQAYDELIAVVEEKFPDIALQVRDEVARGRQVSALERSRNEQNDFQTAVIEKSLGRITRTDVAVQPYSSDEQILLLLRTLRTLANSMSTSRRAVVELVRNHANRDAVISFTGPPGGRASSLDQASISKETELLITAYNELSAVLSETMEHA